MSSKSTIILTDDNEHWFDDCSETLSENPYRNLITLEFSKKNIRIEVNDDEDLIISIINPYCEIYDIISKINKT